MQITCGRCGHKSSAWAWMNPVHQIELPDNGFQCPNCKVIVQRRCVGCKMINVGDTGEVRFIPERIELVETFPTAEAA
jgi:hypothetical protein